MWLPKKKRAPAEPTAQWTFFPAPAGLSILPGLQQGLLEAPVRGGAQQRPRRLRKSPGAPVARARGGGALRAEAEARVARFGGWVKGGGGGRLGKGGAARGGRGWMNCQELCSRPGLATQQAEKAALL